MFNLNWKTAAQGFSTLTIARGCEVNGAAKGNGKHFAQLFFLHSFIQLFGHSSNRLLQPGGWFVLCLSLPNFAGPASAEANAIRSDYEVEGKKLLKQILLKPQTRKEQSNEQKQIHWLKNPTQSKAKWREEKQRDRQQRAISSIFYAWPQATVGVKCLFERSTLATV